MNYSYYGIKNKQRKLNSYIPRFVNLVKVSIFGLFIALPIGGSLLVGLFAMGLYKGILMTTPHINIEDIKPAGYSTFVYDVSGNQLTKLVTSDSNRIYTTIDRIPLDVCNAFVAIEDRRFYEHKGIDFYGMARAFVTGLKNKNFSQGASTITQQLIKNNVFTDWVTEKGILKWKRKFQEQYLAQLLEKKMDKSSILELYLNTINLGQNTLGIQAASKRYFGKNVSELTLSEGAVLACIPQNPTKFNPITHPEDNKERREKVLHDMLEIGYINQSQYEAAIKDNVYSRIVKKNNEVSNETSQSYFIDALVEQVMNDLQDKLGMTQQQAYYQLYSGGLSIYSTQDSEIQKVCDEYASNPKNFPSRTSYGVSISGTAQNADGDYVALTENDMVDALELSSEYFNDYDSISVNVVKYEDYLAAHKYSDIQVSYNVIPQPQISATIIDQSNGHVKAIIGGRGNKSGALTFNRSTDAMRQPGSTFKVLSTFLPAFDIGVKNLASTQVDEPFNYDNGTPVHNYYSGYRGTQTLRKAIEQSLNIVTVKTLTDITPQVGFDYLIKLGFSTLVSGKEKNGKVYSDVTQSLALGGITYGVYNSELTAAYASIANYGIYNRPKFYTKILDHDGNILLDEEQGTRVFKESTAYMLISAMEDVITQGTGKAVAFDGQYLAGKTGTTSDNKDVWFAGFSPYYTCAVWAGYDNNSILVTSEERALAKSTWKYLMSKIHEGLPEQDFRVPSSVKKVRLCSQTGLIAGSGCPSIEEYIDVDSSLDKCTRTHYVQHSTPATPTLTPEQQQALLAWMLQQQQQQAQAQQQ